MNDTAWDRAQRVSRHPLLARLSSDKPDVSRRVLRLAGVALAAELAIFASTFLDGPAVVPQVVVLLLAVGLFPLHLRSALVMTRLRLSERELCRDTPTAATAGVIAVLAGTIALSLLAPGHVPGQPVHRNDRYFFDDHGFRIPTDKAGYDRGVKFDERAFSGIPATFFAAGVALNLALLRRRRGTTAAPG